jgi:hypothetical protein
MTASRPSEDELRRAEAATWGTPPADRPRMRLVAWKPLVKNSLRGFATIELPNGLRIQEVPVLLSKGKAWAALPSKPVITRDGDLSKIDGKIQYAKLLEWRSREPSDGFSARVVALVRQAHPEDLAGESAP